MDVKEYPKVSNVAQSAMFLNDDARVCLNDDARVKEEKIEVKVVRETSCSTFERAYSMSRL